MSNVSSFRPEDFRLHHKLQVRWSEVDLQGVVFNGHYLNFFDVAVGAWWNDMAMPQGVLPVLGGDFFVRKATVEYLASARLDDWMDVCVRAAHLGNTSMRLEGALFIDGQLSATAELHYVFVDGQTRRPAPIPESFRQMVARHAAGQVMVDVQLLDWPGAQPLAAPVRTTVFVDEQGVPAEEEWDADDARCVHAVALNALGQAVATGRLLPAQDGVAKIGRMAVLRPLRRRGLGEQVLAALEGAARARGDRAVALSAQLRARAFYERAGYAAQGEPYDEVGIAHVRMLKYL